MIESPLLVEMMAKRTHENILEALKARFGPVPRDVARLLREILNERRLTNLVRTAATCPDLEAFREALLT